MMNLEQLPVGNAPAPVSLPHFPTRWQAVVWRLWGLVPIERVASLLHADTAAIENASIEMGLDSWPAPNPKWLTHGYLTLIRACWHLLPYSQLLELLNWTPDRMAYTLKEEDFFWHKVGQLKPACDQVRYSPLSEKERESTRMLKASLQEELRGESLIYGDQPFSFLERFEAQKRSGGTPRFAFNFIHSYCASCGDVLLNTEDAPPAPKGLLAQYASMGIDGIWIHALLHKLCPIPGAEKFSDGHELRMANLKKIVSECSQYGLKVFLYFNEPRCMPMEFYDIKPEWGGIDVPKNNTKTICTTRTPEPLQWLEKSIQRLFTEIPGLGGLFCITMSENPTNCHYKTHHEACPYCATQSPESIIANVICAMERGMHSVAPNAKMIAYDWAWTDSDESTDHLPFKQRVMDLLPRHPNFYICSVSEWGKITHVGGVEQSLVDYSISQVGPSDESKAVWKYAQSVGVNVVAKIQMNNSWELSAVPYIPVPYLVQEHLENLQKCGVKGLMLSWTLGGFPEGNIELLDHTPEEIAANRFHGELAADVCRAWHAFSDAFREFPFYVGVIYYGPMNYGPMNLLHLTPTNYNATMIGFPYDSLTCWRGVYPEDVFEEQFRKIVKGWTAGMEILKSAREKLYSDEEKSFGDIWCIAQAADCHLTSTLNQIRFVRARERHDVPTMVGCARDEIKTAHLLYSLVRGNSILGFEASNHYYYTLNDLREKIISCKDIIRNLCNDAR